MIRIFIYSQNHLNLEFWKEHIAISGPESVQQFRDPEAMVQAMQHQPGIVLIDNYFCEDSFLPLVNACQEAIDRRGESATLIHVSPRYADQPLHTHRNYMCSSLSPQLLAFLNQQLLDVSTKAA